VNVLFGGTDAEGTLLDDTCTWDGETWTEQHVAGPSGRMYASMATLGSAMVLFGGGTTGADGEIDGLSDTWTWNGASWTEQHVALKWLMRAPPPRVRLPHL
jgi:hypothetical protein